MSAIPGDRQADEPSLTLTVSQAARLLGISRALAYDLVRTGEIPSIRLGRRIVVPRRVVTEFIEAVCAVAEEYRPGPIPPHERPTDRRG